MGDTGRHHPRPPPVAAGRATSDAPAHLGCPSLAALDAPRLETIDESLQVYDATALPSLGDFPVLHTIGGDLFLWQTEGVEDLGGLSALTTIGGQVLVEYASVATLDGLEGLTSTAGIYLGYDDALVDVGAP